MFLSFFSLIPLGADKLMEGDIHEWDRRAQWREQGFADWYLHINPGQTWGHFSASIFFLKVFIFALKPKIHAVIFKLFSHRRRGFSHGHASFSLSHSISFQTFKKKKHQKFVIMAVDHLCLLFNEKYSLCLLAS